MKALVAYGEIYVYIPACRLDAPLPAHPERVCPERPLTETEKALASQLSSIIESKRSSRMNGRKKR
ncbi:DUF6059 family protein [Streptomyces marokkonensis]|uniref:DUF6059 family protein n=1 Tax=Streptomyces marokkonensis TaxID=324855 RepID=A0ABW6QE58_9ACTN